MSEIQRSSSEAVARQIQRSSSEAVARQNATQSIDDAASPSPQGVSVETMKFSIPQMLSGQSHVSIDGEYIWPIAPHALLSLYEASPEHNRAIHVKGEGAFGRGLTGKHADRLDALTDAGFADLAIALDVDWETYGNAFCQVIRSRDGTRILKLRRLPATTMSRFRKGYLQRIWTADAKEKKTTCRADEVIHFRSPCPTGQAYSLPSWIGVKGMMGLANAAIKYNEAFFANNAMPEYAVIFSGTTPTKEQKAAIRDHFQTNFQGIDHAHRTLILNVPEGCEVKIQRLTDEAKDADFLKLLDAKRDRMPLAHGGPPRAMSIMSAGQLGGGGEVTGQLFMFEHLTCNPKRNKFLNHMRPVLKELELNPGNLEEGLGDDQIAFLPLDLTPPKDDAEALPDLVGAGIVSAEEARAILPMLQGAERGAEGAVQRSAASPLLDRLAAVFAEL